MKHLFSLLLFVLFLIACQSGHVYVKADLKKEFAFKEGTYWIYTDSLRGITDSLVVTIYRDTTVYGHREYRQEITSGTKGYNNGVLLDSPGIAWHLVNKSVHFSYSVPGLNTRKYFWLDYPFTAVSNSVTYTSADRHSVIVLPDHSVNGQNYHPTTQIYNTDKDTTFNDWFYIVPGIGMVEMNINHPSGQMKLKLLRYHIEL